MRAALAISIAALVVGAVVLTRWTAREEPAPADEPPRRIAQTGHAGSAACRPCHAAAYAAWADSHHARAERLPDTEVKAAFSAQVGGSIASRDGGRLFVHGHTIEGPGRFEVVRVLGVAPLWQPLLRMPDGDLQIAEVAFDVAKSAWFLAFDAPRAPGEWGHWTGRGMRWDTMCADCHNTGVERRFDRRTGAHSTAVAEHGVGCEACHGPARDHANHPETPVPVKTPTMQTCAPCHSRRAGLLDAMTPGVDLLDQAMLLTAGDGALYHPDGQIRDEVFGYASFRSSAMHASGVTCVDCHAPHAGRVRTPGEAICVDCHSTRPDFARHDHHPPGTVTCIDCHMPRTTYMQRHPRHDHGFIVPDPALTVSHGIPNACDRCHGDRGAAWSAAQVKRWFGDPTSARALRSRTLAGLANGDASAVMAGLELTDPSKHPYWRAVATGLLGAFVRRPAVQQTVRIRVDDPDPLVRAKAVASLSTVVHLPDISPAIEARMTDPVRAVRVAAQRALRDRFDPDDARVADLKTYLDANADRPRAVAEMGAWLLARDRPGDALPWLEDAARWDPGTGRTWHMLGLARGLANDLPGAVEAFAEGTRYAPDDAGLWFALGAMQQQTGHADRGQPALRRAAELGHPRAARMIDPAAR